MRTEPFGHLEVEINNLCENVVHWCLHGYIQPSNISSALIQVKEPAEYKGIQLYYKGIYPNEEKWRERETMSQPNFRLFLRAWVNPTAALDGAKEQLSCSCKDWPISNISKWLLDSQARVSGQKQIKASRSI